MDNSRTFSVLAAFLLLTLLLGCSGGSSSSTQAPSGGGPSTAAVTLSWFPSNSYIDHSPLTPAGYKIYYGTSSGIYTGAIDVPLSSLSDPTLPRHTINNLFHIRYYFAVCAYDADKIESVLSAEINVIAN